MRTLMSKVSSAIMTITILRASCPTPGQIAEYGTYFAWQPAVGVNYGFPTAGPPPPVYTNLSITDLGIDGDIIAAFNQWNYANSFQNNSDVAFYGPAGGGPFSVYAVQVNFPGVPFEGDPRVAAQTVFGVIAGTHILGSA